MTPPSRVDDEMAKLHFHDAALDVGAHQHQVTAVSLHGGAHELHEGVQRLEASLSLLISEFWHPSSLP